MFHLPLLLALSLPVEDKSEPVAMVWSFQGDTKLRRLELLRAGDEVVVAPARGSVRLVFLADGHTETLQAGATIRITKSGGAPAEAVKYEKTRLSKGQLNGLRSLAGSARSGVERIRDPNVPPPPVSPIHGATVLGDQPGFVWNVVPDVTEYDIQLFCGETEHKKNLVWSERVRKTALAFPKGYQALDRGATYTWKVVARDGHVVSRGNFTVATKQQVEDFGPLQKLSESKEVSDRLLAAMLFEAGRFYDESHRLLEKRPNWRRRP
jgi:hypothetical protein